MFYLILDENGYLIGHKCLLTDEEDAKRIPSVESLDGLDLEGIRFRAHRWDGEKLALDEGRLAELEALEAEEYARPTLEERNRADIDFLLIMGGYDL